MCLVTVLVTIGSYRQRMQPHFYYSAEGLRELEVLKPYGLTKRFSRNFEAGKDY